MRRPWRRSPTRRRTPTSGSRPDSKRRSCWPIPAGIDPPASGFRCTPRVPKAKRIEVRFPDPAANPYLAFSAMLMAGLDGIENKINPGEPAEKDLYDLEPKEAAKIRTMPGSLDEALSNLEKDHQFLLKGGVFSEDLIEAWIGYKRTQGGRSHAASAASVRVLPVLRRVVWSRAVDERGRGMIQVLHAESGNGAWLERSRATDKGVRHSSRNGGRLSGLSSTDVSVVCGRSASHRTRRPSPDREKDAFVFPSPGMWLVGKESYMSDQNAERSNSSE